MAQNGPSSFKLREVRNSYGRSSAPLTCDDIVEVVPCIGPGVAVSCRRRGGIARGRAPGQDMGLEALPVAAAPVVMEGLRHAAADAFSAPALYRDSVQTHVWGRRRIREGRH